MRKYLYLSAVLADIADFAAFNEVYAKFFKIGRAHV